MEYSEQRAVRYVKPARTRRQIQQRLAQASCPHDTQAPQGHQESPATGRYQRPGGLMQPMTLDYVEAWADGMPDAELAGWLKAAAEVQRERGNTNTAKLIREAARRLARRTDG